MSVEVPGEAEYVVTSDLVVVRTRSGYEHLYRYAPVPPGVDPDQIRMLLDGGMIAPTRRRLTRWT